MRTPAYVLDVARLKKNLAIAARIRAATGCRMLLATKAFALPAAFPLMREALDGTTASGEYEARLGRRIRQGSACLRACLYGKRDARACWVWPTTSISIRPLSSTRSGRSCATPDAGQGRHFASIPAIRWSPLAARSTIPALPARVSAPRATAWIRRPGTRSTSCTPTPVRGDP